MVIVKLVGGLGNQLFQYSFGQYLKEILNTQVRYDVQTNLELNNFTTRQFGLDERNLKVVTFGEIGNFKRFSKGILWRIERKIIQAFPFLSKSYFVESKLHKAVDPGRLIDNCYYDGYWQSLDYLVSIDKEKILNIITLDSGLKISIFDTVNKINNVESVSLHIRRGDYLTIKANSKIFAICDINYYLRAIEVVKQRLIVPKFYIFSDDIAWAKDNFKGEEYTFIEGNSPNEDLYLMSQCKHNIIANSTFSWWGAWLNPNLNKIVIAPKLWYNGDLNKLTKNLIMNLWIRI